MQIELMKKNVEIGYKDTNISRHGKKIRKNVKKTKPKKAYF